MTSQVKPAPQEAPVQDWPAWVEDDLREMSSCGLEESRGGPTPFRTMPVRSCVVDVGVREVPGRGAGRSETVVLEA